MEHQTVGMAKFRATFPDVIREVEETQQAVVIAKHGQARVALIPAAWLKDIVPNGNGPQTLEQTAAPAPDTDEDDDDDSEEESDE